jgi:putative transcriptional regulator
MPTSHIQQTDAVDTLLAEYAAGTLPLPVRRIVEAHLEMTPGNRRFVEALEMVGGAELEAIEPQPLADRDARLAAIFAQGDAVTAPGRGAAAQAMSDARPADALPSALSDYLPGGVATAKWRRLLPSLKECQLDEQDGIVTKLMWVRRGAAIPSHTHHGTEITLVLSGGFTDGPYHAARGDIVVADDSVDHRPIADADEDCICIAITDAPLRLTGPIGRLFAPLMRG